MSQKGLGFPFRILLELGPKCLRKQWVNGGDHNESALMTCGERDSPAQCFARRIRKVDRTEDRSKSAHQPVQALTVASHGKHIERACGCILRLRDPYCPGGLKNAIDWAASLERFFPVNAACWLAQEPFACPASSTSSH